MSASLGTQSHGSGIGGSTVKTTIKTDLCCFTEYRIYPGKGKKFVSKDGKVHMYICSKAARLARQKVKPVKLMWTQAWRRSNKKVKTEGTHKRRTRKTGRLQKAIVGLSLEEFKIKKQRADAKNKPEMDVAFKEAAGKKQKKAIQATQKRMNIPGGKKDVPMKQNLQKLGSQKTKVGRKK